jgi:putative nucleotidyltransferase with HDIG domain
MVGKALGPYRLVTEIGDGGMGVVYYAEHSVIGRRAAIKILHPEVARDELNLSRFLIEARAANAIRHPNVVDITDIGEQDGLHYIVMSFLEGETLGERLERTTTCDEATTIRIVRQVASALAAAHEAGILHRDLKPENIFLMIHPEMPDYVKILDFGIAKLMSGETGTGMTGHGLVVGTPDYMSPEQCSGGAEIDGRSDIYSLGVVMYQMLAGKLPFEAPSGREMMVAHLVKDPPPLHGTVSPGLGAIVHRMLQKDPAARFATMRDVRAALDDVASGPAALPARPSRGGQDPPRDASAVKEARPVSDKLADIIMDRIANDRLVIPTMPQVAIECMAAVRASKSFRNIGDVVAKDPLLASRVLRLANSAAFPSRQPATTMEGAVGRMGTDGLATALVQFSLHQTFTSRDERIRTAFKGIWEHSLAVALLAREIAQTLGSDADPNAAYLAGLLHDIGKPVVATLLLEAERLLTKGNNVAWMTEDVWRKVVDRCHREVAVALAKKWTLPEDVSRAIEDCAKYDFAAGASVANVVRLANALAKRAGLYLGQVDEPANDQIIESGRLLLKLPAAALDPLCAGLPGRVATLMEPRAGGPKGR